MRPAGSGPGGVAARLAPPRRLPHRAHRARSQGMSPPTPSQSPTAAPPGGHDLKAFFRAVGRFGGQAALSTAPEARYVHDTDVDLLDTEPCRITADPLALAAVVDGVQASLVVTYRSHRPVLLSYTGAAAVDPSVRPLHIDEHLEIVHCPAEGPWVFSLGSTIPTHEVATDDPLEAETQARDRLGGLRAAAEQRVVEAARAGDAGGTVLVDGGLRGYGASRHLVGVVKSHRTRYLPDESVLWGLPGGWRSPRFRIAGREVGQATPAADRYSCYVRLFDASEQPWNFGLVRLETFDPERLDPLAAAALRQRQPAGSDARWDVHLKAVRGVEDMLRARRPAVFGSLRA